MNKRIIIIAVALAAVLALAGCTPSAGTSADKGSVVVELGENIQNQNKLTVTGTGTVKIMPDVAYVTIGVITNDADAAVAQQNNRQAMNAIFEALKKQGLTDDDMRTTNYSTYPRYDYDTNKVTSYEVSNMVELTITDIDNVGKYIDVASENGANTAYPVRFSLLDQSGPYNQALELAMTTASGKAQAIISASGNEIVGTLSIQENSNGYTAYERYDDMADSAVAEDMGAPTPITAGELEISATVTVIYEIN